VGVGVGEGLGVGVGVGEVALKSHWAEHEVHIVTPQTVGGIASQQNDNAVKLLR